MDTTLRSVARDSTGDRAQDRARRLFQFLKAYAELKQPRVGRLAEEEWSFALRDLPAHEALRFGALEGESDADHPLLRVRRALFATPPTPPASLEGRLVDGWDDPLRTPILRDALPEDAERFRDAEDWLARRAAWAVENEPALRARRLYDRLFALKGRLDREGERIELLVGNGLLRLRVADGVLEYPILLQRAELVFDPVVPEFVIRDADRDTELERTVLERVPNIRVELLRQLQVELEEQAFHPLDEPGTREWLARIIHQLTPGGTLQSGPARGDARAEPELFEWPVLLLRRRAVGVVESMQRALEAVSTRRVPLGLRRVLGVDETEDGELSAARDFAAQDALLSKPANEQQLDLVRQLETRGAVLVQGPPGTGKSHTIANLIGHLIATGQRVLVTSHTTKALRVLRGHVAEKLRPLCVSLLDDDQEGRRQLETAINHIQKGLHSPADVELERSARELAARRDALAREIERGRAALLEIRRSECTPIVLGPERIAPAAAAAEVRARETQDGWIPGPIAPGLAFPLRDAELEELYSTNLELSPQDEADLSGELPAPSDLPDARAFAHQVALATEALPRHAQDLFSAPAAPGDGEACEELARALAAPLSDLERFPAWKREVVCSVLVGAERRAEWEEFARLLEESAQIGRRSRMLLVDHEPELPAGWTAHETEHALAGLVAATSGGRRIGALALWSHPSWKRFVAAARVQGRPPRSEPEFQSLQAALELANARTRLSRRWNALVRPLGFGPFEELGERPEEACAPVAADLRACMGWWAAAVVPWLARAEALSLSWPATQARVDRGTGGLAELKRAIAALGLARQALLERARARRILEARRRLSELREGLRGFVAPVADALLEAAEAQDVARWESARARLLVLRGKRGAFARRRELLGRLREGAGAWARRIERRSGIHGEERPPGSAAAAWRWLQLETELRARAGADENELGRELERALAAHLEQTIELIDRRGWLALRARTGLEQQQALVGWADLIQKAGKRTGKRAPRLLAEARRQLEVARDAVPVWIMPLARVFETIDPRTTSFDVVVIDEASQADVTALFALLLGARVVIVGDHEQVSPEAVGQRVDEVESLIGQYLEGIPNAALYWGATSIYDLARQSFPGQLRLLEHFRCVREIIEFSNRLSYDGTILPLRDGSGALAPHLVEQRVQGSRGDERVNPREVEELSALVAAAIEQPEYAGKTFGVVSLLGDDQALLVDEQLRRRVAPREIQERQLICGNAAQFQGDERDVIFVTMVDASRGSPLGLKSQDKFKQRYNVAASRARDQLWLVHSLDTGADLKPDDLRLRLIRHVRDPRPPGARESEPGPRSVLEELLVAHLRGAGYRLRTQYEVGAFRIAIVVEGSSGRIALECDGDRERSLEELEADMARQRILERLHWRFLRLRGSRYYRDPERALAWLEGQLTARGIRPIGPEEPASDGRGSADELVERVRARAAELRAEWYPQLAANEAPNHRTICGD